MKYFLAVWLVGTLLLAATPAIARPDHHHHHHSRTSPLVAPLLIAPAATVDLPTSGTGPDQAAVECLALTVYHEARGMPPAGREAVADVVVNRAGGAEHVCAVVYERRHGIPQFAWLLKRSHTPTEPGPWEAARRLAVRVLCHHAVDITHGATFFRNMTLDHPSSWLWGIGKLTTTLQVERTLFLKLRIG